MIDINVAPNKSLGTTGHFIIVFSMSNTEFIRRAYALADSGKYSRVSEIRAALAREGFSLHQLSQLSGKQLALNLKARIAAARQDSPPA